MPMPDPAHLSPRQAKWFQSVRTGLETTTGRTLAQWAEIARACPEHAHRQRLAWMKAHHGLGQNHASLVLNAAFPALQSWAQPDALGDALWADPQSMIVFEAVKAQATALPEVIVGQRKGFTAFSRQFQFAAARPRKGGGLVLGLAIEAHDNLAAVPRGRQSWSDRLTCSLSINSVDQIDSALVDLLKQAWARS
jgi:hypothetical protein